MPTGFLHLPGEIRNVIYADVLVKKEGKEVQCTSRSRKNGLTPGLLTANRKIYREAITMLYSQNRFQLCTGYPLDKYWFSVQIGRENASYIRHIVCPFPTLRFQALPETDYEDIRKITSSGKWFNDLGSIERCYGGLETFTMTLMWHQVGGDWIEFANWEFIEKLDGSFKAMHSPPEIILNIFSKGLWAADSVFMQKMKPIGWTINIID